MTTRMSRFGRGSARWLPLLALFAVVAAAVLVWGVVQREPDAETAGHGQHAALTSEASTRDGTHASDHAAHGTAAAAPASPQELSVQLQGLLGQHFVLAADMMRSRVSGNPDFAQAANAALGKNTEATSETIGSLFGAKAKAQFTPLWTAHVTALFNYARGLAGNSEAARAEARAELVQYEGDLGRFFANSSGGRLKPAAAQAAMTMHVDQLLQQVDAYSAENYVLADRIYRAGYSHAYRVGGTLAAALLPPAVAATLQTPMWRLRTEMYRLLGEHVELVVDSMRSAIGETEEFAATAEALNGNTREVTAAMATLFGPAAAKQFQSLWADHVDALMAYTAGVAKQDEKQRAAASAKLNGWEASIASFLAAGTGNRLASAAIAKAIVMHDQMLLRQVDAFAAKDYQKAHDITYSAMQQMLDLSGQVAGAIGATIAARLPAGGMQTGGGAMAGAVGQS